MAEVDEPLVFVVPQEQDSLKILIHQVASEETEMHNVGYVMWPSSVTLARWITKNPSVVLEAGGGILELGAGCGLVGLTAATLLQQQKAKKEDVKTPIDIDDKGNTSLFLTDYDPAVLQNLGRNISLNKLDKDRTTVVGLDFFDQPESGDDKVCWVDMDGSQRPQVSLILAADILCYSNDADLVSNTIQAALVEGGQAIVVAPNDGRRFGVDEFPEACRKAGLLVNTTDLVADSQSPGSGEDEKELLVRDLEQTTGFTQEREYNLTMFTIDKPISQ